MFTFNVTSDFKRSKLSHFQFSYYFIFFSYFLRGSWSFREGNGNPFWYSCLENPMDAGAWWAAVHGVTKSRIWLSNFTFHFHALEKGMATHSSVLAWRIQRTAEPGGLPSVGSHRVGHDLRDLAVAVEVCFSQPNNYNIIFLFREKCHYVFWEEEIGLK